MEWIQLFVVVAGILGTILGVVIPLHLHTLANLKSIQDEMKDFHGRLICIEERRIRLLDPSNRF